MIEGHSAQRQFLAELIRRERLPSTMLFAGPAGIGKRLIARELARTLLCENQEGTKVRYGGCSNCPTCKLFDVGNHPDFFMIECASGESSQTDSVRGLLSSLNLKAFSGSKRVVIFNDAHDMSTQAVNILLKALEEPRPDIYYILVTANRSRLLPTLVSRCQIFSFHPLNQSEMQKAAAHSADPILKELSSKDHAALSALADGSLENLSEMAGALEYWNNLGSLLDRIARGDNSGFQEAMSLITQKKESLPLHLSLLKVLCRDRMRKAQEPLLQRRWAITLSNALTAERLVNERNLGPNYVVSTLLAQLMPGQGRTEGSDTLSDQPRLLEDFTV